MDVGRLGLAALVVPAPLPAWRVPVSSGQLLPACRLSWEQGGQLAALWTSDERDRHRGFLLRVALLDVEGLTVLEHTLPDAPDTRHPDVAAIFPAASRMQRAAFEVDGVHDIPFGPVHAGIIEPGHFRFQIVGEKVLRL